MQKGIVINEKTIITPVAVSTICGHAGMGLIPLIFYPKYLAFMSLVRKTGTTELSKSSTFQRRRGNFLLYDPQTYKYIQRVNKKSLVNAHSNTNFGVNLNTKLISIAHRFGGFNVILNFSPDFSKSKEDIVAEVFYAIKTGKKNIGEKFKIIEIASCPNRKYNLKNNIEIIATCIRAIKKEHPDIIVIIKKNLEHPTEAAVEWEKAGMDILHGINAVSWNTIFPGKKSPLKKVGGGAVSGSKIISISFEDNCKTRKVISTPMIFGGGIPNLYWAQKCFEYGGANSISLCTSVRCDIKESGKIIRAFNL